MTRTPDTEKIAAERRAAEAARDEAERAVDGGGPRCPTGRPTGSA